ncbi:MAG: DNA polymerase IV [Deltaproteobacteria bacterium]|nr:DNA polymerase IV [Deltaproteobacteria bacterium]MBI3386264.1 DNA polymerase IV [Deltaproteobacteria bacterium]
MVPVILHADMDAFYASVEQRDRPELRGKPVIVGGTGVRGVVNAASYEARVFGVHSAMPTVEARRLCADAVFLPGRMNHYVAVSREIQAIFEEFTPQVEPLSLDEAFLDVTASLRLLGSPVEIARALKARVKERTHLVVSVGIGPTKMIAKIASGLSKPDGLVEVRPEQAKSFLAPLSVDQLWGVGPVTCDRLRRAGLTTVGQLAAADPVVLQRVLGDHGVALWELANGRDARSVDPDRERKSYGEENTFERDMRDGDEVRRSIIAHAEAIAQRLRHDGCAGLTVTLKVKLAQRLAPGRYPLLTRRTTLAAPTDDGKLISDTALRLWREWALRPRIRLVGVSMSGIKPASSLQLSLFDNASTSTHKRRALNRAVDAIAARFGDETISRGLARAPKAAPTLSIKERRPKPVG